MSISIIAAVAANGTIGNKGALLGSFPEDMKRFKELAMKSGVVIMGRKTHESIGRYLPSRVNVIVTRKSRYNPVSALGSMVLNLDAAVYFAQSYPGEVMVIGGEEIYREFLPLADKLYITNINAPFVGDTYFPGYVESDWVQVGEQFVNSVPSMSFDTFVRANREVADGEGQYWL